MVEDSDEGGMDGDEADGTESSRDKPTEADSGRRRNGPEDEGLPRAPERVRAVYDEIASHFAQTRANPWPEVEAFVDEWADGPVGLDVGCANGRHLELLVDSCETVVGVDLSRALLTVALERVGHEPAVSLMLGDAASLPITAGSVDTAVYVATLHHLPNREARRTSLTELRRVLSPDGTALVSAWSTAHERFDADAAAAEGFDSVVDWTLPGGKTVPRFYHIYARPEFERDIQSAGLSIAESVISSGNCYARVTPNRE